MGKEITLGELSASAKTVSINNEKPANINGMKPISISELGKDLEKAHPEIAAAKAAAKQEVTPELVEDAFSSLTKTIEEKKKNADKMVENLEKAIEDKKLDQDMKDIEDGSDRDIIGVENSTSNILDDLANLEIDEDEEKEEPMIKSTPVEYTHEAKKEEPVVEQPKPVEAPKEKKIEIEDHVGVTEHIAIKTNESNSADVDNLLNDISDDSDDIVEDDDQIVDEESTEEAKARLKKSIKSIVVTKDPIDLSKFTISDKPVSASTVLNYSGGDNVKRYDFPLYHSKKNVTHSTSTGVEIENLRKTIANSNGVNAVVASLRFIWNHIIDANKPEFEVWCKSIKTEDIESLYAGHYFACYADANLMPVECKNDKCGKTSIVEIDPSKLIRFDNDDVEKEFKDLKNETTTSPAETVINATLMQISDDYVVSIVDATLYTTFVQYATLKPEITEKYSDILNGMAYIDKIFRIDRETNTLRPIKINEYRNSINKTVIAKLKVYAQVLKTLTADQYNILTGKLNNIINVPKISFVRPEVKCPVCGETIQEEPIQSMLNTLFTRAQLAQAKSL